MRISLHIKELLGGAALVKLALGGVQFACLIKFTPLGVGEHLVTVIVLQGVGIKSLQVTDVGVFAFAHEPHQIVLLIKPVGIAKGFIAASQIPGTDPFTQKCFTISEGVGL